MFTKLFYHLIRGFTIIIRAGKWGGMVYGKRHIGRKNLLRKAQKNTGFYINPVYKK